MNEMIKVGNDSYGRYEELLLRRDAVRKEGYAYEIEYHRVFGELIIAVFREQLKCAKKKKAIEFCQAAVNHGRAVEEEGVRMFVDEATGKLHAHLDRMVEDYKSSKETGMVTELDLLRIKKIYHKLVKLIHPEINPKVGDSKELKELWNRIVTAYNNNDLKMLQELEVLTVKAVDRLNDGKPIEIEIPDIERKIADIEEEIRTLIETDPYQYKFLLADSDAVEAKKASLSQELKAFQEYGRHLDGILADYLSSGADIKWLMN